jgi:hypothetical protein
MKVRTLLLALITSHSLQAAEPLSLMTMRGVQSQCRPMEASSWYRCENGSFFDSASPESSIVRLTPEGTIELDAIESTATQDGEITFLNRNFHPEVNPEEKSAAEHYFELYNAFYDLMKHPNAHDNPDIQAIVRAISLEMMNVMKDFAQFDLNITLENGKNLQCSIDQGNRPAGSNGEHFPNLYGADIPGQRCGVYSCQTENEEQATLYFQSSPSNYSEPMIVHSKEGQITGFSDVAAIRTKNNRLVTRMNPYNHPSPGVAIGASYSAQSALPPHVLNVDVLDNVANEAGRFTNPSLALLMSLLEEACQEAPALIGDQQDDIRDRLVNANIEQAFLLLNDNFTSLYLDPSRAHEHLCKHGDRWYSREAWQNRHYHFQHQQQPTKVLTVAEAQALFNKARAMDDIAFNYPIDGCYARAHLMARRFEEEGHYVEKAWINGNLLVQGNPPVRWGYHVAPSIYVQGADGKPERRIIDPSMADRPLSVDEWTEMMTGHLPGDVHPTSFPFPYNSSNFHRASLTFSNSDPYYPSSGFDMSEADKLAAARATMDQYLPLQFPRRAND